MLKFDLQKPNDVVAFGRATIDLYANEIGPMEAAKTFSKYVGGSPANTAVAMARLGLKVGYIGKVSDDQFGRFIVRYLADQGVDTSHIETAASGIRSGVTMGEIKEDSCNCFMYRTDCADLHIDCAQLDESYIASHKLLLISGTSLSHSPAREAVFLAIAMAKRNGVVVAFDLDYRDGTWDNDDETSIYFSLAAQQADMVLGTREEFDKMEELFHPAGVRAAHPDIKAFQLALVCVQPLQGSALVCIRGVQLLQQLRKAFAAYAVHAFFQVNFFIIGHDNSSYM